MLVKVIINDKARCRQQRLLSPLTWKAGAKRGGEGNGKWYGKERGARGRKEGVASGEEKTNPTNFAILK